MLREENRNKMNKHSTAFCKNILRKTKMIILVCFYIIKFANKRKEKKLALFFGNLYCLKSVSS